MKSRLVTIEEANRMIPLLHNIVEDIRSSWDQIIAKRTELEFREKELKVRRASGKLEREDSEKEARINELKADLNALIERINNYIREVEDLGCYVEEFKRGIVNFPSLYHGRKVFLCWAIDEETVSNWHELDESYNDRVRIRDPKHFLNSDPQVHSRSGDVQNRAASE